jgi:predicted regulator of Ras-like GTPase activity (Roadblock/LC7/MglB family)
MERILTELNKTSGILGSFVVGRDGIVISSDFASGINDELMGALASSVINTTEKAAEKLSQGTIDSIVLEAQKNKLLFLNTRVGFLVAFTTNEANLGLVRVEMKSAAAKLEHVGL